MLNSQLAQRGDARAGATLLTVGFALQMFAYFHSDLSATIFGYIDQPRYFVAVFLLVAALSYALMKGARWHSRRSLAAYENQLRNPQAPAFAPKPDDKRYLDGVAAELGASRLPGETEPEFADRLTRIRDEKARAAKT